MVEALGGGVDRRMREKREGGGGRKRVVGGVGLEVGIHLERQYTGAEGKWGCG